MHIIGRETGFEPATYRSLIEVTLVYGTLKDQSGFTGLDQDLRDEMMNRIKKNESIPRFEIYFIRSSFHPPIIARAIW